MYLNLERFLMHVITRDLKQSNGKHELWFGVEFACQLCVTNLSEGMRPTRRVVL